MTAQDTREPTGSGLESADEDTGPAAEPPQTAGDPLFGSGLVYSMGWVRHDDAASTGFATVLRHLPRLAGLILGLCWRADRRGVVVIITCQVAVGASNGFGLLATNRVLARVLSGPTAAHLRAAASQIALVAALTGATALCGILARAAAARLKPVVERVAYTDLLARAARVEMLTFENAGFKDLLDSAQYGAGWLGLALDEMIQVVTSILALVAAAGVLGVLHPALACLLPVIVLPRALASARSVRRRNASRLAWIPKLRQQRALTYLLTAQGPAEETRTHDAGTFLLEHYQRLARASEAEQARLAGKDAKGDLRAGLLGGAVSAGTYLLLGYLLATSRIPLAAGATALLAIRMGTGQLSTLVRAVNLVYEYGLYVADLAEAIEQADAHAIPATGTTPGTQPELIEARAVTFTYSNTTRPALQAVDVTIRRGQIVALVGANGSGKTTLARLLAGLYLPDEGEVLWDAVSTRDLDRRALFDRVAVLSQGFERWPFTAAANVGIGRHERTPTPAALDDAAQRAGADTLISSLAQGWDTLLAPEHQGGVDLSGGQWQLAGLARAFYRDAPILVLDEPTAALDPRIEADTFERVRALSGGRTVLMITHRLYSVRHADRIIVLHSGQVIESGTHEQLIAAGGEYSALYRLQAEQFDLASLTTPDEHH